MAFLVIALLVAIPLIEIALFIRVGGEIGGAATVLLTILNAASGLWIVRLQGFGAMIRFREQLARQQQPVGEIFNMVLLFFAGFLLLVPGFMTDFIGALLLLPPLRALLSAVAVRHARVINPGTENHTGDTTILEGEYWEDKKDEKNDSPPALPHATPRDQETGNE